MKTEEYKFVLDKIHDLILNTMFEGHVYTVGGCVRDTLMKNQIKDIDLVIDLPDGGIRFANWLKHNDEVNGEVVTYPTYGTAMFHLKGLPNIELECVQTRKEQYHDANSRNSETSYGTIMEDAMRRDLTINALYYNISTGQILDPTGKGITDIAEHRIRVTSLPEIVYEDDPLHILRCIRFACRYNWEIDKDTYNGMCLNVDRLSIITKERISDELNKMLTCSHPVEAVELIRKTGAMHYVIPELEETYRMKQNKYHFGTVWEHTMKVLGNITNDLFIHNESSVNILVLRLAALLHDIGKAKTFSEDENGNIHFYRHELASDEMIKVILARLKYSNHIINAVCFLARNHMLTKGWGDDCAHMKNKTLRKLQYKCGWEKFIMLLCLIDADNKAHAEGYCMPNQVKHIYERTNEMIKEGISMFDYKLPIDGNDVMETKRLKPGREVKEYLDYALKLAYAFPNITREDLIKHIKGYKLKRK